MRILNEIKKVKRVFQITYFSLHMTGQVDLWKPHRFLLWWRPWDHRYCLSPPALNNRSMFAPFLILARCPVVFGHDSDATFETFIETKLRAVQILILIGLGHGLCDYCNRVLNANRQILEFSIKWHLVNICWSVDCAWLMQSRLVDNVQVVLYPTLALRHSGAPRLEDIPFRTV